jgi:5-methyltetrahydrofolate--homocysteine methyltransferase
MARTGVKLPLLIGGATTSRQHTAVKIAPEYPGTTVHVLDASRAVGVVSTLLDQKRKPQFDVQNRAEQDRLRVIYGGKSGRPLVPFGAAREGRLRIEWKPDDVPRPAFVGMKKLEKFPIGEIARYIDWTYFFSAWELRGKFPNILESPEYGKAARELYGHGKELLDKIAHENLLQANGVYGFWPAESRGEDIVLFSDETRTKPLTTFSMLRQQSEHRPGEPYLSLADFVAPRESGIGDYVGAFAVTAGLGTDALVAKFEREHDDYNAIMVKALADRLAEAFAELLHQRARHDWGYEKGELTNDDLIAEKYRGIRPAFGYPACPDHSEKGKLFDLLGAEKLGLTLTDSFAMLPTASVSGIYLGHPEARYFNLGRVGRDQVTDYAARKGVPVPEVERWFRPNLGYE